MSKVAEKFYAVSNSLLSPGFLGTTAGLAVVGAVFAPVLLTIAAMVAAFLGTSAIVSGVVRGIRNISRRSNFLGDNDKSKSRQQTKSRKTKKEKTEIVDRDIVYDRRKGRWNISALPIDMKPTVDSFGEFSLKGKNKLFDVGGIRGAVWGQAGSNGIVTFSFKVGSEEAAIKLADIISQSNDRRLSTASITHTPDGKGYICTCVNPEGISLLFRKAEFKAKEAEVKIKTQSVNQYEVKGCKTAEEAREKFERLKAADNLGQLRQVNTYECLEKFMDGKKLDSKMYGQPYEAKQTELGTYIINDVYVSTTLHKSMVKGGEMMDNEQLMSNVLSDSNAVCEKVSAACEASIDGVNLGKEKVVSLSEGKVMSVDKMMSLSEKTMKSFENNEERHYLRIKCDSPEAIADWLNHGKIPVRCPVSLVSGGKGMFNEEPGVICVPVDRKMLDELYPVMTEKEYRSLERYSQAGIDSKVLNAAAIGERLKANGECSVISDREIPIIGPICSGTSGIELRERLLSENCTELNTIEHLNQWAKDASMIDSVNITVDPEKSQLVIKSTVNNGKSSTTKIETRTLTKDELDSVSRRLPVSPVESKDFLMQLHPEYFKTYQSAVGNGKGMFADPVQDFLAGRKPETLVQKMKRQKAQKVSQGLNTKTAKATAKPKIS